MRILGAVIAGGQSRRMGEDKAFTTLNGVSLIARVISRIRFQVNDVIINANRAERFQYLGLPIIADRLHTNTPLAGLHACLAYAAEHAYDAVLTTGCDQPFLPLDLVTRLEEEGRATGAAVGQSGGQTHYLTGLWSAALAAELERNIARGMHRVQDFVNHVATEKVDWPIIPHDPFFNVNSKADLKTANEILAH
jgi:molybdenum cofactor guanylyltransferase